MEEKLKNFLLLFFISVNTAFACVIGPQQISRESAKGFEWIETDSDVCTDCRLVEVKSPGTYQGYPASHAVFSVYINDELLSKSISEFMDGSDNVRFIGVIRKAAGVTYKVTMEYGEGRCMKYEIDFGSSIELSE